MQDAGEGGVHKARSSLSGDECHMWKGHMTGIIATQEQAVLVELVLGQCGRALATEQGLKCVKWVVAFIFVETEAAPYHEFLV